MGIVDEGFELFGRTETGRSGEEIRHMVTERTVIRMLLDSHYLDAVIAEISDTRQDVLTELLVGRYFLCISRHTDMALVDEERLLFLLAVLDGFMFPLIVLRRPNLCGEDLGVIILHDATSVARDTFSVATVPLNEQLVELSVLHGVLGQNSFPNAVANGLEAVVFGLRPVVHVTLDIDGSGVRCPFAEYPTFVGVMQSEIEVTGSPVSEGFASGYFLFFVDCVVITALQRSLVGLQIRVGFDEFKMFCHSIMCLRFSGFDACFDDEFAELLSFRCDTGLVCIGREEDHEVSNRHVEHGGSFLFVEFDIFAFVVFGCHVLAVFECFPSHLFVACERNLDVDIVFMCLERERFILFALEVDDVDEEVVSVEFDFSCSKFFQVIVVEEVHELFKSWYAVEVEVSVFDFVDNHILFDFMLSITHFQPAKVQLLHILCKKSEEKIKYLLKYLRIWKNCSIFAAVYYKIGLMRT